MYRTRYGEPSYFQTAAGFADIARREGLHPATLAVAWVRAHPAVTAPLIGARNEEQLEPSLKAASLNLGVELYAEVSALSLAPPPATDRSEEGTEHNLLGAR